MKKYLSLFFAAVMVMTVVGVGVQPEKAVAATTTVYDALPSPLPYNAPSQPFQAQQTFEFGDYIHLGGTDRLLNTITVAMSDWALYSDYTSDARYSGDSVSWTHPITINVYGNHLGANGVPDNLLVSSTQNITIPWRPAADLTCPGGTAWRAADNNCYNGYAFNAVFDLSSYNVTLPNDVIVSLAYNTQTYGVSPIGSNGPYNSLNVLVPSGQTASVGSDDSANEVFWNTSTAAWYTDGGASGVNIFRKDTNWSPNGTIAMKITATSPVVLPTVKVHILKYLDNQKATSVTAGGYQFPMASSWNAANIGSGSGTYVLGNAEGGAADQYGADTSAMTSGASYSTAEVTGGTSKVVQNVGQCTAGKYYLDGYQTSGVSFADASVRAIKKAAPALTDITTDQYIIVRNMTCPTTGKISGMKFNDKNRNGMRDSGEEGLAGWTITLRQNNAVVRSTVTDSNGNYVFENVTPGTYRIREVHQNGWKRQTKNPSPYTIKPGSWFSGIDFGNAKKLQNETEDTVQLDNRDE